MLKYVIGLDGGGTKTISVVVTEKGEIVSRKIGSASNFQVVGDKIKDVLVDLIHPQLQEAGIDKQNVQHLYAGLAGAGRASDREKIGKYLSQTQLAKEITIDTDAAAALAGAFGGEPGIILISGTGAICFGKKQDGEMVRSGGWGYLLGDEGSGFFIGQQAIIAALKMMDGRGDATKLKAALEKRYMLNQLDEIIPRIYSGELDRTEIADIGILVFELAETGDKIAREIINLAAAEQGKMVAAVAEKMAMRGKDIQVALIGSVFKKRDVLESELKKQAQKVAANVDLIDPLFEPAIGSAILALKKIGVKIDDAVLNNLMIKKKGVQK